MVEGDSLHVIRWASCRCKHPWRLADVEEIFDLASLIHASFSHSMGEAILWRSPWQRREQGGGACSLSLLIKSFLVTDKKNPFEFSGLGVLYCFLFSFMWFGLCESTLYLSYTVLALLINKVVI